MKKYLVISLLLLVLCLTISACDSDNIEQPTDTTEQSTTEETKHVHSWGEWNLIQEALCAETGINRRECLTCDDFEEHIIAAKGHTEVLDEAIEATCATTGLTEGKHCSVCNATLVAQTVINTLEHTVVVDEAVNPTCTTTGLTEGNHCSVCDEILVAQTIVAALGHTKVIDSAVAATCTTIGLTEGKHCSVCDEVLIAQTVVGALGHTKVIDSAVDATCATTGLTEGMHCSVCDEVLAAQTIVEALGHTEVIDAAVDATCATTGLTEGMHCSVCDEVLVAQTVVDALGHTEIIDAAVGATCTGNGLTEGSHCEACGETIIAQEVVNALGHKYEAVVTTPTCTTAGYTTHTCSACDDTYIDNEVVALGHTIVNNTAVSPTCTETGLTEGSHCEVCGETIIAQEVVAALGHKYEVFVTTPTCTQAGYTTNTCTTCGDTYVDNEVVALGHTIVKDTAVSPTCTATGLTEGKHCSVCNEVLVAQTIVEALGHTEVIDAAVDATCTVAGLTQGKHCSVCNVILVSQTIVNALGHSSGNGIIENNIEPDCNTEGSYDMVVYCIVCNEELSRTNYTLDKKEHQESNWIIDITVSITEDGLRHTECTFCKLVMAEEVLYAGSQGMEYTLLEDGTYAVSGRGSCTDSKVYIPRAYQGIPVTRIEYYAFAYNEGIAEIVFGKNITSIVDYAFYSCSDLETVRFTGTLADWCSITFDSQTANPGFSSKDVYINGELMSGDLIIPADVTHINNFALYGWGKLTSITLSEGIKTIGAQAFGNCSNLKSITFPDSVTKIGAYALSHCRSLENITFNGSKCQWTNITKSFGWNSATGDYVIFYTAGDHIAGDIVLENEIVPDCINDGSYDNVIYCTKCKTEISRETIQVGALDHTEVIDAAVAATCTTTGLTEGKHCSVCNTVLVEQNTVSAIGHSYDNNYDDTCNTCGFVREIDCPHTNTSTITGYAPTCTESGLTNGVKCDKCNDILTEQIIIPAIGHTEVIDAAVAATCTTTGLTEGKHCSVCDEIFVTQTIVSALGHTEVVDAAVDATCTTTGLTEGKHCSVCDEILVAQTVVDALGHTEIVDAAVEATCTTIGLTEGTHCSACNTVLVEQTIVSAIGHSYDDNYDDTCNTCGFVREADCPHTNTSTITGYAPTCTESGLTDGVKCNKCNEVLTEQTTIPATGHTEISDTAIAATCTTTGLTEGKHCSVCNEILVAQTIVDALGHTEIIDTAVAATCTTTGLTEGKHCSVCNEILIAQAVVGALGHTEVIDAAVDATCTNTGLTEGKHCSVCNTVLVEQTIVSAIEHSYDDNYDDTCNTCGFVREADCPHANTSTIAGYEPTCTESGLTDGVKCDKCDEVLTKQTTISATGHTEVIDAAVDATCTTTGLTEGTHCSVCCEVIVRQEIIAALDHNYKSTVTPPTATENGSIEYICSICNNSYSKVIYPTKFTVTSKNRDEIGYTGTMEERLTIPAVFYNSMTWNRVTSIDSSAFSNCSFLTHVTLPNSVTSIGDSAFANCSRLTNFDIPASVTSIGDSAFSNCISLYSFSMPANLLGIGASAFYNCSSLTIVKIPDGVFMIGDYAFYSCKNLTSVTIGKRVTSIGSSAFFGCENITNITLPNRVTSIENYTFYGCKNLTSITIPDSMESIGRSAFTNCTNLTSIKFVGTIEQWNAIKKHSSWDENTGNYVVSCTDGTIDKDGSTTYYEKGSEGLEYLLNGDGTSYSVTGIGSCSDFNIIIPSIYNGLPVTRIGDFAFFDCATLTSITIPSSVTSISLFAFLDCTNLESIIIPEGTRGISYGTFSGCTNLTSITMPNSLIEIEPFAFQDCLSLTSITISDSIQYLDDSAFSGCTNLTEIIFEGTIVQWNAISKTSGWDSDTGAYTIFCTNGTIRKDNTVTYY